MRIAAIIAASLSMKAADGRPAPPISLISALDAHENLAAGDLVLIDVRSAAERAATSIPEGALTAHFRDRDFLPQVMRLVGDFDTPTAFISRNGQRSMQAAMQARAAGFTHLFSVTGGHEGNGGWLARGLPVVPG
ncbi:MAG: rhodanese-like domain-containing protein [Hyphomonas sp.]